MFHLPFSSLGRNIDPESKSCTKTKYSPTTGPNTHVGDGTGSTSGTSTGINMHIHVLVLVLIPVLTVPLLVQAQTSTQCISKALFQ